MVKFSKYHGLGNDFVMVRYNDVQEYDLSKLAVRSCDRHTGIGADGLIIVKENPLEMIYYNSDGSRAKMCGNGIRCFAHFVYDEGIQQAPKYDIKTLAGTMVMNIKSVQPFVCEVDMGVPSFKTTDIPMKIKKNEFVQQEIEILGKTYVATSLLMGATHTVIQVDNLNHEEMIQVGTYLNNHPLYPNGTNVNFFELVNESEITMQTFERGAGLTLACGTGACATVAANQIANNHKLREKVIVNVPLGTLTITNKDNHIFMEGPAKKSFEGVMDGDLIETV